MASRKGNSLDDWGQQPPPERAARAPGPQALIAAAQKDATVEPQDRVITKTQPDRTTKPRNNTIAGSQKDAKTNVPRRTKKKIGREERTTRGYAFREGLVLDMHHAAKDQERWLYDVMEEAFEVWLALEEAIPHIQEEADRLGQPLPKLVAAAVKRYIG